MTSLTFNMTKSIAFRLAAQNGFPVHQAKTFSSKNKRSDRLYWANPNPDFLGEPWTLILNDWENRILYVLDIPANSFDISDFYLKSGYLPNVEIDPETLTDVGPGSANFNRYVVGNIKY